MMAHSNSTHTCHKLKQNIKIKHEASRSRKTRQQNRKKCWLNYLVMILIYSETRAHTHAPDHLYWVPQKYMKYYFGFAVANDVRIRMHASYGLGHTHAYQWRNWMDGCICVRYLTFLLTQTCFWHWYSSAMLKVYFMPRTVGLTAVHQHPI